MIKSISLAIIAICFLANTIEISELENGGFMVYFGNFGYYIE